MSVIPSNPNEIKSLEVAAVELCGPHVGGPIWPALYFSNRRAFVLLYGKRDLTDDEKQAHRREYAQAQDNGEHAAISPAELMNHLQQLFYNCEDLDAEGEQARRVLVDSVASLLLPADGGERTVNVDRFASIQRPDFNHYRITTRNPAEGHRARVYLMNGKPHPLEGFTTTDPRKAFQKMWEMHDVCALHCVTESTADLLELDRLIHEEGKTFAAASIAPTAFRIARARAQAQAQAQAS
ncbi:hypothetical protein [Deinococcus frigens]|uniref:hypothetical protein n=1 Tax=Deinococcus frigens TaxID=249403 RepID=UPI000497A936|nr:hypothetical protein [Deinococcus frigens]